MTPRIACVLTTPRYVGGTETSLVHAAVGFSEIGCDVDIIAVGSEARRGWTEQSKRAVTRIIPSKYNGIEDVLSEYDGIVLSNLYFQKNDKIRSVLLQSDRIPKWTSGWHSNSLKIAVENHELLSKSSNWSGSYVSFWPTVRGTLTNVRWVESILPYRWNFSLASIDRSLQRDVAYDFMHVGRIDHQKGVYTLAAGLEWMARHRPDLSVHTLIAGSANEMPGGPFIHRVFQFLECNGWQTYRESDSMRSRWSVTQPKTGSTITYTGSYDWNDVSHILDQGRCFVNFTSGKATDSHLEYSTLEALDAGCTVVAATDWPAYHYGSDEPRIFSVPDSARYIVRGKRVVYNDFSSDCVDTTYATAGQLLCDVTDALAASRTSVTARKQELDIVERNRRIVAEKHDPTIAARAYLRALDPGEL